MPVKKYKTVMDESNRPGQLREKAMPGDIHIAEKTAFRTEGAGLRDRIALVNTVAGSQEKPLEMPGEAWTWIGRLATMLGHKGPIDRVDPEEGRDLKAMFRKCPFEFADGDRQHAFREFLDLLAKNKGVRVEFRWIG
jgi:hypothetical protein